MSKKINYSELIKETLILTVAVAVIAAAVFFFLVPSHASVSSISGCLLYTSFDYCFSLVHIVLPYSPNLGK